MRKDFIRTAEVKLSRKKRLEENRIITSQRLSTSDSTNALDDLPSSESVSQISEDIDSVRFYLKIVF
jgi:hypothetical protein